MTAAPEISPPNRPRNIARRGAPHASLGLRSRTPRRHGCECPEPRDGACLLGTIGRHIGGHQRPRYSVAPRYGSRRFRPVSTAAAEPRYSPSWSTRPAATEAQPARLVTLRIGAALPVEVSSSALRHAPHRSLSRETRYLAESSAGRSTIMNPPILTGHASTTRLALRSTVLSSPRRPRPRNISGKRGGLGHHLRTVWFLGHRWASRQIIRGTGESPNAA